MTQYKNGKGHEDKQTDSGDFELVNLNSISIDGGFKHSGKFINESDDGILYKNDLVMILSDVGHGDLLGRVALIPDDNKFILNQRVALLRPNKTANPEFLFFYINSHQKYFKSQGAGMSQLNISKKSVETFSSLVPNIDEQKKISLFLMKLDSLIALHQRKLEHLQEQKKGLLQKMFPKNGEIVPEVRFPGFTDAWEQRKFEEFATYSGKKNKANLDLEPYAITSNEGFIKQNEAHNEFGYMKNTDRSAYNIVQPNSFGYNPARINIGSIGYYSGNSDIIVSSLYEVFKTNADIDDQFLSVWFKSSRFKEWINKLQEGSVRLYFYYDKLSETKIKIPSFTEQKHIGYFFNQLDSLIALHQRKLEHLELMKKGLLQQMFV